MTYDFAPIPKDALAATLKYEECVMKMKTMGLDEQRAKDLITGALTVANMTVIRPERAFSELLRRIALGEIV